MKTIGLLGTRFTMEKDFYSKILKEKYKVDVIIPTVEDRDLVHNCIYKELVREQFLTSSKKEFQRIIRDLQAQGVQGMSRLL